MGTLLRGFSPRVWHCHWHQYPTLFLPFRLEFLRGSAGSPTGWLFAHSQGIEPSIGAQCALIVAMTANMMYILGLKL